jgi:uncharacterized membrane protein YhaH (DUF805 family)
MAVADALGSGDANRISLRLAIKAVRDTFRLNGRSTRTELASYVLGSALAGVPIGIVLYVAGASQIDRFGLVWQSVSSIPLVALLVRRLHDQGRRGGWAVFLAAPLILVVAARLFYDQSIGGATYLAFGLRAHADSWPLSILFFVSAYGLLLFYIAPPEVGTNRYGGDPRLDP